MRTHDEPLTTEELSEIYRREKGSRYLAEIRSDFYRAIKIYISQLKKSIAIEFSVEGYSAKAKLASSQLTKAQEDAKEVFRFRFSKIQAMALRVAMGGRADLKKLTREEIEFFNATVEILKNKYDFLNSESTISIDNHPEVASDLSTVDQTPIVKSISESETKMSEVPTKEQFPEEDTPDEIPFEDEVSEEPLILPPSETVETAEVADAKTIDAQISGVKILVRILEDIPGIAGIDRNYKLKKEDVVTLPAPIAKILITQKAAFPINTAFIE